MVAVRAEAEDHASVSEQRFVIHGVSWETYVTLRDALDDHSSLKLTYLSGTLELMSPSNLHEDAKKIIASLIEVWAMEHDVDLRGFGGATFRRQAKERGLEPDECYKLGKLEDDDVPDIAIEVIVTNALVNKMAVYAGLGVREVWEWRPSNGNILVHCLLGDRYETQSHSSVLPALDIAELSRFVTPGENQTRLAKEYQATLRSTRRG